MSGSRLSLSHKAGKVGDSDGCGTWATWGFDSLTRARQAGMLEVHQDKDNYENRLRV